LLESWKKAHKSFFVYFVFSWVLFISLFLIFFSGFFLLPCLSLFSFTFSVFVLRLYLSSFPFSLSVLLFVLFPCVLSSLCLLYSPCSFSLPPPACCLFLVGERDRGQLRRDPRSAVVSAESVGRRRWMVCFETAPFSPEMQISNLPLNVWHLAIGYSRKSFCF